jgi:adenylate kinase
VVKLKNWIVTGISGSGRVELLNEIAEYAKSKDKKVMVHDVGKLIFDECLKRKIPIFDKRILNINNYLLQTLRASALKEIKIKILENPNIDINLIGIHCMFRWKRRLISGISFSDLADFEIEGFLNIVDNVKKIYENNSNNPKWDSETLPNPEQTQEWMMEEEFVTHILSNVINKPMYIVAREHNTYNLFELSNYCC